MLHRFKFWWGRGRLLIAHGEQLRCYRDRDNEIDIAYNPTLFTEHCSMHSRGELI